MSDHDHPESHGAAYFRVFLALVGFTIVSVAADLVHLENKVLLGGIVLAVATAKALCVMMFFMHLKFERAWKYLLLAPTIILALALPLSLRPDIGETYYTPDVPQIRDYAEHEASLQHGEHAAEHH
ncbi:cytochrome C oxidase subunit IV family protein [Schlesneria paludicola]|uniref:cytochrome C oxidase subunit IV family protein n=1 Tax=Schlesneria paludicola TaxID=360056 RepID=UPI00029AE005|nr:cytochrome C oxidase subunit IV family protein [Schlesneria paludicola]